ncbi:MAG TPA: diaminopimelate decarboxylase [Rhizomicrobium sp.]|nr:diaminopimelate decarboxylase [Rhizomicrobium sp.]
MNSFDYRGGRLFAEDVVLTALAADVGTPFYCYSTAALRQNYEAFARAAPKDTLIAFSVKANGNLAVLKTLAAMGAGADVVSGGELRKALAAGIPASRIVFSGVGKTRAEMALGLEHAIHQFNVESEPEMAALDEVARSMNQIAPITIRINPDVDALTHAKITTGTSESKFGIPASRAREAYGLAASLKGLKIVGIDAHIGSQITKLEPFEAAFGKLIELIKSLRAEGHNIERADFGGGLGVSYDARTPPPSAENYGAIVSRATKDLGVSIILEPGRAIVANAGILVAKVIYVKNGEERQFLILDAAMNDLIRPAMYDAHHEIVSVAQPTGKKAVYDVVGPICESSDRFAEGRELPELKDGDLVAILSAGAYGAVMSSAYNARPPAPEVLVKGGEWAIVRPRLSYDDLIGFDRIPGWLAR